MVNLINFKLFNFFLILDNTFTNRNSPYTEVSYIHSSDGTNGSSKTGKNDVNGIRLSPPGNILDLVPPPPNDIPSIDSTNNNNVFF